MSSGFNIGLPALCIAWGLVCTFQGFVTSYGGLVAARKLVILRRIVPMKLTMFSLGIQDSSLVLAKVQFYQCVSSFMVYTPVT